MQHIINIAFDFDDEKVKNTAERVVNNELSEIIKNIVTDKIAPKRHMAYGKEARDWGAVNDRLNGAIGVFLAENKDAIMEMAAKNVADTIKRSKKYKAVLAALENGE